MKLPSLSPFMRQEKKKCAILRSGPVGDRKTSKSMVYWQPMASATSVRVDGVLIPEWLSINRTLLTKWPLLSWQDIFKIDLMVSLNVINLA